MNFKNQTLDQNSPFFSLTQEFLKIKIQKYENAMINRPPQISWSINTCKQYIQTHLIAVSDAKLKCQKLSMIHNKRITRTQTNDQIGHSSPFHKLTLQKSIQQNRKSDDQQNNIDFMINQKQAIYTSKHIILSNI